MPKFRLEDMLPPGGKEKTSAQGTASGGTRGYSKNNYGATPYRPSLSEEIDFLISDTKHKLEVLEEVKVFLAENPELVELQAKLDSLLNG